MENGMLLCVFDYSITVWQEPLRFDGCSMRIHPRLLGLIFLPMSQRFFPGEFESMLDKPWIAAINGYAILSKYIDHKGVS